MGVTQRVLINDTKLSHKHSEATTLLAIVALSIVLLIGIYFASASPGTALGDFASMTVFLSVVTNTMKRLVLTNSAYPNGIEKLGEIQWP